MERNRSWLLTLPADEYDQDYVETSLAKYTYVGQLEKGEDSGYLHWQIYIENPNPIAFTTLQKKFPKGHFEVRKGTKEDAYFYVIKDETSQGVRISNGTIDLKDRRGQRTDIEEIRSLILEEGLTPEEVLLQSSKGGHHLQYMEALYQASLKQNFGSAVRPLKVHYIYGAPGVGKTRLVYDTFGFEDIYRVNDYRNGFDGYRSQDVLVLDEFYSQIKFPLLLQLLDIYPVRLPARYHDRQACYTKVFILSNVPLSAQYAEEQGRNPAGWQALLRRIHKQSFMDSEGHLKDESFPF